MREHKSPLNGHIGRDKDRQGPSSETPCCATCSGENPESKPAEPLSGERAVFKVEGLDCAEEVAVLRRAVGPLVGGAENLAFDILNGRMTVLAAAAPAPAEIITAVRSVGMSATQWRPEHDRSDDAVDQRRRSQVWFTSLSGFCVALGFLIHVWFAGGFVQAFRLLTHAAQAMPLAEVIVYALAIAFGARFVIVKAWHSARGLRPDMNLLMTVAIAGAIVIGEWFEAATVAFLFALSLTLESWSVTRARRAIAALLDLVPPTVRLLRQDRSEADVALADVAPGDLFIVRAGERIALDGRVVAGMGAVNQAPITGESAPVEKQPGAEVFGGTINGDGVLTIEVTRLAEDTLLARIAHMVEQAHARRAPAEQWIERFARIYTPTVMALATAVFLFPPLVLSQSWDEWFYRALVLLVIACPMRARHLNARVDCRLACGGGAHGRAGQGRRLYRASRSSQSGRHGQNRHLDAREPVVAKVLPLAQHTVAELLARAAALESRSTHPLAQAILRYAAQQRITAIPAMDVQMSPGRGAHRNF